MRTISRSAPSATASAPAAVSAFTLCTWPVLVGRDGGHHGDAAGVDQVEHGLGAHLGDLADQAEVDLLTVEFQALALGGQQSGVLAGQPDGERTVAFSRPTSSRFT